MESVDRFKKEMQARVDELKPYVEEYAQIEQLLAVIDNVKTKAVSNAGAVVAQFEEAVPAFKQETKPKRKRPTRRTNKRVPRNDNGKTRVGLVKKYLAENGVSTLRGVREYQKKDTFTFGSVMNAMDKEKYGGYTWPRALANSPLVDRLIELKVIELVQVVQGKQTRKYYAIVK